MALPSPQGSRPIGLTFSGGGFRATLFHLGVTRFLYETGMLRQVTHITSVSGGSILAAHLVLNWERYTGTPEQFEEAAKELVDFTRWDLRGRVVRPWLASWAALALPRLAMQNRWIRTSLLQRGYDRLFRGACLRDLERDGRPQLHILATSMSTGQLVSFGQGTMRFNVDPEAKRNEVVVPPLPADSLHVALAVTASSAFPPLFPPVRISHELFGAPVQSMPGPHHLTDGGVFDNLGIRKLLWLNREQDVKFDLVVVSDAQREFTKEFTREYPFIWGRAGRSVDLLMDRVSWFENDSIRRLCDEAESQLLECRLQHLVDGQRPYALPTTVQCAVQNTRTDLDAFTGCEINSLVHQGMAVARAAWEEGRANNRMALGTEPAEAEVWRPLPGTADAPSDAGLARASHLSLGLFRGSHAASWVFWGLLFTYLIAIPVTAATYLIREANHQKAEAMAQKARADDEARERINAEQRARVQAQHVNTKIRLIKSLGQIALAAPGDEWDFAREAWDQLGREIRSIPWFAWFLDQNAEKIQAAFDEGPGNPKLKTVTLEVAKQLREVIEGTGNSKDGTTARTSESDYLKLLLKNREVWYSETVKIAQRIADPALKTLKETYISRKRFWSLYWGELALVEGLGVEKAMVSFGNALAEWEAASNEQDEVSPGHKLRLKQLVSNLDDACRDELALK